MPAGGTDDQRRVTLDGRRSAAALQSGTTAALQFCWEQIAGPSARIENVYAPLTRAWLPSAGANDTRLYRFALYVDTGLDRSEAFNVSVAQRGSSTSPAAFLDSAGGYRGGGGCAMVEPGEGGRLSDWLPVWVPAFLALLGVRRRRRSMP
ncbi:MAG: hypothetical protein HY303_13385 [Candidatus Wallbacteria bacterium]|nr:hypothetical protein [Candidatus Wallbacteria bacterium]